MTSHPSIVWFRQDLRIQDHPALHAAVSKGGPIIPVYIWAPDEEGEWAPGAASKWWLHRSLQSLKKDLAELGLTLILRTGSSVENLQQIAKVSKADTIFWHRRYEPEIIKRDTQIKQELGKHGVKATSLNGSLLHEPWTISTKQNTPFKVFTPYWNCCLKTDNIENPLPIIPKQKLHSLKIESAQLDDLALQPTIPWDTGLRKDWHPGESHAHKILNNAAENIVGNYPTTRDRPDLEGVSKLSPYLHFGEISPRQVWHTVLKHRKRDHIMDASDTFLKQIGWREFSHYLLYHFPTTPNEPLHEKFKNFPWKDDKNSLLAWQKGLTGYPLVDAGMRQLWHTGWMHNRVRMIVASFLVKDLMIPWQEGARWFWDTLVDADLANNTMGWQWTAGCGADAAPYFRIFNPITQGDKFDITKEYVRTWVPELAGLADKWLYQPWLAPELELRRAGVILGKTYPKPIVDHSQARLEALAAYHNLTS